MRGYSVPTWSTGSGSRRGNEAVPPSELRVSDADRREIADVLSRHFADGRLDQSEFDERVGQAMAAKTRGDLTGLLQDLPTFDKVPEQFAGRVRRRSNGVLVLLAALAFVLATSSWAWNSWAWRSWVWHPHLPFLVLALLAVMIVRRSRSGRHRHRDLDSDTARSR